MWRSPAGLSARSLLAIVLAYAVALQLLLVSYTAYAQADPGHFVICSSEKAPDDGSAPARATHCLQCGWVTGDVPDPPAPLARPVQSTGPAHAVMSPAVPVVSPQHSPRLAQGPPPAA